MSTAITRAVRVMAVVFLLAACGMAVSASHELLFVPEPPKVVIGEEAHVDDVLAAVRLVQAIKGVIGRQPAVVHERVSFSTPADLVEFNEPLGRVRPGFTSHDLPTLLASGDFRTKERQTKYNQYLRFNSTNATDRNKVSGSVIYGEDDINKKTNSYLYWNSSAQIFEWLLEFEEGVRSEIEGNDLESLEGKRLTLLGEEFFVAETTVNTSDSLELKLIAGPIEFAVGENDEAQFSLGPREYQVAVLAVADAEPQPAVKLQINDQITRELREGEMDILDDGTVVAITEIVVTGKDTQKSLVQGYLGGRVVRFHDDNILDSDFRTGGVDVNGNKLGTSALRIQGSREGNSIVIRDITYRLFSWKNVSDLYVPKGDGVRSWIPEPEALLTDRWDILYAGNTLFRAESLRVTTATYTPTAWVPQGEHTYKLNFTSQDGYQYAFGHVTNELGTFMFGEEDRVLHFKEPQNSSAFPIKPRDRFVVSDASIAQNDDTARSHVFEYSNFDPTANTITLTEMGFIPGKARETRTFTFDSITGRGAITAGGNSYVFFANATTQNLSVDLNQNGTIQAGDEAIIATRGNALIDLGDYNATGNYTTVLGGLRANITMITLAKRFKDPSVNENLSFLVEARPDNKIGIMEFPTMVGGTGYFSGKSTNPGKPELELASTGYGVNIEFLNPGSNESETLTLQYPYTPERASRSLQTGHQVIITATIPTEKNASAFASAAMLLDRIAAKTTGPLILVGGPCANTFTATVLNLTKKTCTKGFAAGTPMVELLTYQKRPVFILAGLTKEDTQRAVQQMIEDLVQLEVEAAEHLPPMG
jgi:hypothetical protein